MDTLLNGDILMASVVLAVIFMALFYYLYEITRYEELFFKIVFRSLMLAVVVSGIINSVMIATA